MMMRTAEVVAVAVAAMRPCLTAGACVAVVAAAAVVEAHHRPTQTIAAWRISSSLVHQTIHPTQYRRTHQAVVEYPLLAKHG